MTEPPMPWCDGRKHAHVHGCRTAQAADDELPVTAHRDMYTLTGSPKLVLHANKYTTMQARVRSVSLETRNEWQTRELGGVTPPVVTGIAIATSVHCCACSWHTALAASAVAPAATLVADASTTGAPQAARTAALQAPARTGSPQGPSLTRGHAAHLHKRRADLALVEYFNLYCVVRRQPPSSLLRCCKSLITQLSLLELTHVRKTSCPLMKFGSAISSGVLRKTASCCSMVLHPATDWLLAMRLSITSRVNLRSRVVLS
jgi:hypothetical protein